MEILSAFSVFDPSKLPESQNWTFMVRHYSSGPLALRSEEVKQEWKHFKVFLAGCHLEVDTIKELAVFLLSTPARCELFPNHV